MARVEIDDFLAKKAAQIGQRHHLSQKEVVNLALELGLVGMVQVEDGGTVILRDHEMDGINTEHEFDEDGIFSRQEQTRTKGKILTFPPKRFNNL